jgi:3-oxoacyl-[acyl-carrier protein] reductase
MTERPEHLEAARRTSDVPMQQKRFKNMVAVVTGGGSGIGQAIADGLAREGARVVIVSIVESELREVGRRIASSGGKCLALKADVTKERQVKRLLAAVRRKFGAVDILVNCAGMTVEKTIVDMSARDWDRVQNVNLKACFLCAREVLKPMMKRNFGKIVNIASICSKLNCAFARGAAYCSSKAGALSLTAAMAAEVRQYDININAILPARTNTAMFRKYHPKYRQVNGLMEPEDIAPVALFLCSEDARAVKGVPIEVSNGQDLAQWDGTEESGCRRQR